MARKVVGKVKVLKKHIYYVNPKTGVVYATPLKQYRK